MLPKNFWYVVEHSHAVKRQPKAVKLMDHRVVLYRNAQEQLVALKDQCAHRGAALSAGWVEGNCLRCPYHGWKFESNGTCMEIPANPPGVPIPKRARVDTYPVQEKYGFIWLFLGDLPEDERPPIPSFPQFDDPNLRCVFGEYTWNANYTRVIENTMDCSHTLFLHNRSLGKSDKARIEDYEVVMGDWEASAVLDINIKNLRGIWQRISGKDIVTQRIYRVCMPNVNFVGLKFANFQLDTFMAHIPVDAETTITKWATLRNFLKFPLVDANSRRMGMKLLGEDEVAVKTQLPRISSYHTSTTEVLLPSDGTVIAYRKLLKQCADRGWLSETPAFAETYSNSDRSASAFVDSVG